MKAAALAAFLFLAAATAYSVMIIYYSYGTPQDLNLIAQNQTFIGGSNITVPVNTTIRFIVSVPSGQAQHGINITGAKNRTFTFPAGKTTRIIFRANITGVYDISCSSACGAGPYSPIFRITAT